MTDRPRDTQPAPGGPRWIKVVLVLSLAANLLIVGLVLGAMLGGDRREARNVAEQDARTVPFIAALEPSDRRQLVREMRAEGTPLLQARQALRGRFEAFLGALRAEEFDRAAVEALLVEQRAAASSRQDIAERLLLNRLETLSPEARRAYADRLERSLRAGSR